MLRKNIFTYIISCVIFLAITSAFSQENNKTISGKIIDGQTLSRLPFANVAFTNLDIGTSTDIDGNFSLKNSLDANTLIISYVGYKSLSVDLTNFNYNEEHVFSLLPINIYLQEITIYSSTNKQLEPTEISELSIQSERIRELSAGIPDILRSVQYLPGISANNEFNTDFNVRGGNQDENLILVNGAKVYEPYHLKEAVNASVGIFNVDLIQKADLITGGFSARYGDRMSSVLNIQYREGNREKYSGAASISLAYLDGYAEGPISDKSSFIFGFRKSYIEYLLSLVDYEDISTMKPAFYDVQGVVTHNFSPSNKILFEFIHAGDNFRYLPDRQNFYTPYSGTFQGQDAQFKSSKVENEDYNSSYYSNLFDIQSINALSSKAFLNLEISYYKQLDDEYKLYLRNENQNINILQSQLNYYNNLQTKRLTYDTLNIETIELKSDFAYQFTPAYEIDLGAGFQEITYDQIKDDFYTFIRTDNYDDPTAESGDTIIVRTEFGDGNPVNIKTYKYNAYLENILQLSDKLTFNVGGRIDYFDLNKDFTFSPRISAGYNLSSETTIRAAWGHYYQSPIYRQLKSSAASDTNTQSQMAIHYILGLEHLISLSDLQDSFLKFKIEAYYKDYRNLISSWFGIFNKLFYTGYNDASGYAQGVDLYAVLNIPSFYCSISYGLLYAKEKRIPDDIGEYPRYTDQRHSLSFITRTELGANWNFILKGAYGSGFPYTPRTAENNNGTWEWKSGKIHSEYLPAYKRIDVRISKDFIYSNSSLNLFVDISNVFNFKNVQYYDYKAPGFSKPVAEEILLWPILPSLGIRYKF